MEKRLDQIKNILGQVYPEYYINYRYDAPKILIMSPYIGAYHIEIYDNYNHSLIWKYEIKKTQGYTSYWVSPIDFPYTDPANYHIKVFRDNTLITPTKSLGETDKRIELNWLTDEDIKFVHNHLIKKSSDIPSHEYRVGIYIKGDFDYIFEDLHPKWQKVLKLIEESDGIIEFNGQGESSSIGSQMGLFDLHSFIKIIEHNKTKKIIEFGTCKTGTAHIIKSIFPDIDLISVDKEPDLAAKEEWKKIVPDANLKIIVDDINKIGKDLILKEQPDLLLLDYEHETESSIEFTKFALKNNVRTVVIHDVNSITTEAIAATHLISSTGNAYQILKTPNIMGILAISACDNKEQIPRSFADEVVKPINMPCKKPYYLSYSESDGVTLHIISASNELPETYKLEVIDNVNREVLFSKELPVSSNNLYHYFQFFGFPWHIQYHSKVYRNNQLDYEETLDLKNRTVLVEICQAALGDTMACIPHIFEFQKQHSCNVEISIGQTIPTLSDIYENTERITFVDRPSGYFYKLQINASSKFKRVSQLIRLGEVTTDVLGIEYKDRIYDFTPKANHPQISPPYVCIAPTCTRQDKQWNWYGGQEKAWQQIVDFLNDMGYKVVVISKEKFPLRNVIDKTGALSLTDRITDLTHSEFFIGLSSGLSWLAHSCKKYVFMIIGPIAEWHEFETNICKIYNHDGVCLGCGNIRDLPRLDGRCPLEKDYQCTKFLEPTQVIAEIEAKINFDTQAIQLDKWEIVNQ